MNGKRLCSMSHPAGFRGERACRFLSERALGVLWRHSNVNLVEAAVHRTGHGSFSGDEPKITKAVSIHAAAPQPALARR